jgi:hypothetical protein
MENSEIKEDYEKKMKFENLVYKVENLLDMKPEATMYDYETVRDVLKKYLSHKLEFTDLIKPEEIFNMFLYKFKNTFMIDEKDEIKNTNDE